MPARQKTEDKIKSVIKRKKSGKSQYFGEQHQKAIELYIDNLVGTLRHPLEDEFLENKGMYGFFSMDSRLDGEFVGSISGTLVGFVGDDYVSGSSQVFFESPEKLSVSVYGPGYLQTHMSGVYNGYMNGAFEGTICKDIYENGIKSSFETLVSSLIHTYKINFFGEDVYAITDDCVSFLFESLHKYDPKSGKKAYSYFNVCGQNWLIGKSSKLSRHQKRHVDIDDQNLSSEIEEWQKPSYSRNPEDVDQESEFLPILLSNIDEWIEDGRTPEDEVELLKAVKELFNRSSEIEVINKRSVYMFLREICNFNRSELGKRLKSIRERYSDLKSDYDNGRI